MSGDPYLSVLGVDSSTNAVDLLVDFRTVMVTLLTGASDGEGNARRMPSSDTSDLAETLVRLARQFLCVPTAGDTLETFTLGDSDAINHFILGEDVGDGDGLFQMLLNPLDFVLDGSTIELDLHDVCLLLALFDQANLMGGGKLSENGNNKSKSCLKTFQMYLIWSSHVITVPGETLQERRNISCRRLTVVDLRH
jgi:hypothetical protein